MVSFNPLLDLVRLYCKGSVRPVFQELTTKEGVRVFKPVNRKAIRLSTSNRFSNIMKANGIELTDRFLIEPIKGDKDE